MFFQKLVKTEISRKVLEDGNSIQKMLYFELEDLIEVALLLSDYSIHWTPNSYYEIKNSSKVENKDNTDISDEETEPEQLFD